MDVRAGLWRKLSAEELMLWTVVLEKTLESPLDCKEIQPVHSKGDQSWVFFGRTDAKAETPILWSPDAKSWLIGKDSDTGRDWGQEEKGATEDEMAGWHHWLDGHEFEWTPGVGDGQGGLAYCDSWGRRVGHDWATELIWTEYFPMSLHLGWKSESESCLVVSDSLQPHGLDSPWNSPSQNIGVGSLSLLQRIFPTQGSNPGLPHCRQILYQLTHKGNPFGLRQVLILASWVWETMRPVTAWLDHWIGSAWPWCIWPSPCHHEKCRSSWWGLGQLLVVQSNYTCTPCSVQFSSVIQPCLTLCNPMDCSTPGLPVHYQLPEPTQTHVHCIGDAIQRLILCCPLILPSSCWETFPASGSFPMIKFFASAGQTIGVSASASVLPMNIHDWFPLGLTGWISLQSKGLSRVFSNTTVQKHQFFGAQLSL